MIHKLICQCHFHGSPEIHGPSNGSPEAHGPPKLYGTGVIVPPVPLSVAMPLATSTEAQERAIFRIACF